jgi:hypothetical protein
MVLLKLIRQPENSSLCGQACVATIVGVSLEESIAVFGTKGGTRTKQVIAALRKLGIKCGDGLVSLKKSQKPPLCIVKQHFDDCKHTHWVVYNNGLYYDPDVGVYREYVEGMRETSYLPVYL